MFPACLDLEPVFGAVTDGTGDRPEVGLLHVDIDRHFARLTVRRRFHFAGRDGDGGNEPGCQHRPAQVHLKAALIDITFIEASDPAEVPSGHEFRQIARDFAEHVLSAR